MEQLRPVQGKLQEGEALVLRLKTEVALLREDLRSAGAMKKRAAGQSGCGRGTRRAKCGAGVADSQLKATRKQQ